MAKIKPPLTRTKVSSVAADSLSSAKENMPKGVKALDQLVPNRRTVGERAKQLLRLLLSSGAEKQRLATRFFADLEQRLARNSAGITYKHFGFDSWRSFAEYLKKKVTVIAADATDVGEFTKGMKGRKWWFIGGILFERYIKYGPVRRFLDETARDARDVINDGIRTDASYKMVNAGNEQIRITEPFGRLSAGVEFVLETVHGEKAFLDFGHVAFNQKGYWILPTPTEIKLPRAAGKVAAQFSEFVPRLKEAKRLIVKFDRSDLEKLQQQLGKDKVRFDEADGLVHAEIDPSKLVFDPLARNQMVVKPGSKEWGTVKRPSKSPDVNIGVGTTTKGGGFFYWRADVDVSRTPFENLYETVFLGRK